MKVIGKKVILHSNETVECPLNPSWSAKMIAIYGADGNFKKGSRLEKYSKCPEVLRLAGYDVEIVDKKE